MAGNGDATRACTSSSASPQVTSVKTHLPRMPNLLLLSITQLYTHTKNMVLIDTIQMWELANANTDFCEMRQAISIYNM